MSDGKSFAPVDETIKSPEDRLAELERLWPIIIQKIQVYDKIVDSYDQIRNEISDVWISVHGFFKSIETVKSAIVEIKTQMDQKFIEMSSKSNESDSRVEDLKKSHKGVANSFDEFSKYQGMKIGELIHRVKDLEENGIRKLEIETLKNQLKILIDSSSKAFDKCDQTDKSLSIAQMNSDRFIHTLETSLLSLGTAVLNLKEDISNHVSKTSGLLSNNEAKITQITSNLSIDFDKKLNALKANIQVTPESLQAVKDEIIKKLESVALDGSNAILKSNNSSQQILLLEKKIENIFLVLKKFELSK